MVTESGAFSRLNLFDLVGNLNLRPDTREQVYWFGLASGGGSLQTAALRYLNPLSSLKGRLLAHCPTSLLRFSQRVFIRHSCKLHLTQRSVHFLLADHTLLATKTHVLISPILSSQVKYKYCSVGGLAGLHKSTGCHLLSVYCLVTQWWTTTK